jgi:hypothetical protein
MPITPRPAYPVAIWEEPPLSGAASPFGGLTPYLLTDGSVEFLAATDVVPVGAVEASVIDDEIVVPVVPTGRRVVESSGTLFFI